MFMMSKYDFFLLEISKRSEDRRVKMYVKNPLMESLAHSFWEFSHMASDFIMKGVKEEKVQLSRKRVPKEFVHYSRE
jgi:hypothetical protein